MKRAELREWLMRIAYQIDTEGIQTLDIRHCLESHELNPEDEYLTGSLTSLKSHQEEIDKLIKTHLTTWSFERLLRIDKAILRISINELFFTHFAPTNVVIHEAVVLAKKYSDEDSYRFINGLLSKVTKEIQSE